MDQLWSSAMALETPLRLVDVAIGIVVGGGQVLICRRRSGDSFGGYWEFPGGKIEPGETPAGCVRRELREELDIGVSPVRALEIITHDYPKARIRLHPFICRHDSGEPMAISAAEFLWVAPLALRAYRVPEANRGLVEWLVSGAGGVGAIDLAGESP
jgi:mutator protein MutT